MTLAGFGVTSLFPTPLIRHAMAQGVDNPDKRMIFIFQRGGNDGINTVIPHGDPDYNTTNRPSLYIPPGSSVDLGNGFAYLHPGLQDLMDLYPNDLAIIHRCGYQNNTRSHFDGQRIWENGDPTQPQMFEGWLYRYIQESALDIGVDIPVLSVQATPPLILRGDNKYVNVANPDTFDYLDPDPKRSKYSDAWRSLYTDLTGLEAYRPVLSQTGVKLVDTLDEYRSWDQINFRPRDPNNPTDELFPVDDQIASQGVAHSKGFSNESWDFFRSLKVCALSLLESVGSTNGTRIAGAQINGWDLHDNQGQIGGRHEELLSWLAYGMRSLRLVLNGSALDNRSYPDIWSDTLVATLTEFGRTTIENGSSGTDHAASSVVFVAGGSVNGGVYNCNNSTDWPAGVMFAVNGRYLQEATDYRAVFWEILRDHMGADPMAADEVFPSYTALNLGSQELGIV